MKKRKNKTGLVIMISVLLLLLAGAGIFAYLYFNRPILKINKAIEEDDIETVSELYGSLSKESEILEVQDRMLDKSKDLEKGFIEEELDYEYVTEQLNILGDEILIDNSRFDRIVKNVNLLNSSRLSYEEGMKAFKNEDYESALEAFSRVIKDDDNFDKAQAKIEECRQLLKPDITGIYRAKIDLSDVMMKFLGLSGSSPIPLNLDVAVDITDDSNGYFYMDIKDPEALYDSMIKVVTYFTKKSIAQQYGISEDNIESYVKMIFGKSIEDMVKDEVNIDDISELMYLENTYFTYTVNDDWVYVTLTDANESIELRIRDDDLYLEKHLAGSLSELGSYGVEFPLVFRKE